MTPSDPPSDRDTDPDEPPPSRPRRPPTPRGGVPVADESDQDVRLASLERQVRDLQKALGRAPNAARGDDGSGIEKVLAGLAQRDAARTRWVAVLGIPSLAAMVAVGASLLAILSQLGVWHP
jgi:hypothetical protein